MRRCWPNWPSARPPMACFSAASSSSSVAIMPRRRSSSNGPGGSSRARARSSSRSRGLTTTAARSRPPPRASGPRRPPPPPPPPAPPGGGRGGRGGVSSGFAASGERGQPEDAHQRLRVLDAAGLGERERLTPGEADEVEALVRLGTVVAVDGRQFGGEVEGHRLAGEAGRRPERAQPAPARGAVAGLFGQFPRRRFIRWLDRTVGAAVERSGGDLEQGAPGRRAELADEEQVLAVERDNGDRPGMVHDLALVATAAGVLDGVDAEGDEAAAVHDALLDGRLAQVVVGHVPSITAVPVSTGTTFLYRPTNRLSMMAEPSTARPAEAHIRLHTAMEVALDAEAQGTRLPPFPPPLP